MSGNSQKFVVLQPRDRKLIAELAVIRVIDRELAKAVAGFDSTTRANARLLALTKAGYLKRSFVGTIFGGRKAVYQLTAKAISAGGAGTADRTGKTYSELFLEHQLRVNQVYVAVKHRPIPAHGCAFRRWITFNRVISKTAPLVPDGYFELQHEPAVKASFLEVDLGTEPLRIWQKKIQAYLRLALTGEFQKLFGQTQFKVLVIASSARRAESIKKVAAKFTDKIFRFTSFEDINREDFWSAIWQKPAGDERESLL